MARRKPGPASRLTMAAMEFEDAAQTMYERGEIDLRLVNEIRRFFRHLDRIILRRVKAGKM